MNAPFSAAVDWTGDVGEIWAFVPLPDHILSGPVVINGRAGGTLAAPRLSGGASLTDGRYSNIEFGTLLTNLNAKADFTQDGRVVFDLTGNDGVQGTIAASGSYVVASSTLDSRLSLNNAALVRRDDATAILSGQATAISQGRDIKVDGQFRTNYVEVRLIGNFGSSLTVVDAIPVGESAPLYNPPVESTEAARNIFLNVSLDLPNRVFVRGRGLDSEWGGRLDVTGSAAKPRINGAIERRRGFLDLLGKQFELSIGIVRFSGGTNPFVQVRLQREDNDLIGWIEVVGTAPDLDIGFGSIPDLPEGEILPRLLFGRSKQSLTALEAAQLAAGVATLLSGKAGVLDTVRDAVGVDVLRVESDVDGGTSVITGKYLRDEVFVGAKQNLQSGQTSGLVEVEVFDNFEIEAELGSEEAKGSVGWQIEY
jgi:autotransporter translocation and assembly factor TamB